MLRRLFAGALALVWITLAGPASAQTEVTLADKPASTTIDTSSAPGRYKGIRLHVHDGAKVTIDTIDIIYADGTTFTENRGKPIELNGSDRRTRVIGPEAGLGPEKFIDRIVVNIAPNGGDPSHLRIVGVTSERGARTARPKPEAASPKATESATPPTPALPKSETRKDAAPAGGDVLFGVQHVGFGVDRDVIKVGANLGKFDKIRLRVLDTDIFINELRIVYTAGDPDVIPVDASVAANTKTKWFALKGDRFISEVKLVYKSRPGFRGQARVELYGEYAESWYGSPTATPAGGGQPQGEAFQHPDNRGWLYLGGQQPKFFSVKKGLGYEHDVIAVARNWGFTRLRLDVKDRAITLAKLTVSYADGTNDVFPVGVKVDGGSMFGPVNLKLKPIRDIQVSYRSRLLDAHATAKGYAFVEFWVQ